MQLSLSLFFFVLLSLLSAFMMTPLAIHTFAIPTDRTTLIKDSWNLKRFSNNIFDITSDFSGNIYFVERDGNSIAQLSPATNTITEWTIPTNSSGPIGVAFDSSTGNLYFAENNTNKIGRLVPATNSFTEWTVGNNPLAIYTDSSGNLYFIGVGGTLGRLG